MYSSNTQFTKEVGMVLVEQYEYIESEGPPWGSVEYTFKDFTKNDLTEFVERYKLIEIKSGLCCDYAYAINELHCIKGDEVASYDEDAQTLTIFGWSIQGIK